MKIKGSKDICGGGSSQWRKGDFTFRDIHVWEEKNRSKRRTIICVHLTFHSNLFLFIKLLISTMCKTGIATSIAFRKL
jgi:hypothetical protein